MKQQGKWQYTKSIEQLREEKDFLQYVKLLRDIAKKYVVMIAACDTPWWQCFTKEMTRALKDIGLTVNLYDKYRQSYVAVLDAGHVLFEKLAPSEKELITRTVMLGEHRVDLLSASFDAPGGRNAYININGKTVSTKTRGLNIVVYDKENAKLLDVVNIDTFEDMKVRHSISAVFNNYLEEHPGTQLLCFNTPIFPKAWWTINENFIMQKSLSLQMILENLDKQIVAINRYYQKEEVEEVLVLPEAITDDNGNRSMADRKSTMVNIVDGHRVTELQPQGRKRTIFLLGEENVYGVGVSDLHTTASFLQALFLQNMPEQEIAVENYGQYYVERMTWKDWENLLDKLPVCPSGGDIILWNTDTFLDIPFVDMSGASYEERNYELFFDKDHYTPHGHKLIAEKLYEGIIEQELLCLELEQQEADWEKEQESLIEELQREEEFYSYIKKLKQVMKDYTVVIGSSYSWAGKYFTKARSEALKRLGLKTEFYQKENYAYVAVLDEGEAILEEISSVPGENLSKEIQLAGNNIKIQSWADATKGYVTINGKTIVDSSFSAGIFFVAYDKYKGNVLDNTFFYTRAKNCACMRKWKQQELLNQYREKHPEVVLIGFGGMVFPKKLSRYEEYIIKRKVYFTAVETNLQDSEYALHKYYTPEKIREVSATPPSYHDQKGIRHFYERSGKCVNIMGGHRVTKYQPERPKRTLFLVGGCNVFGVCSGDEHTMASRLQILLNQNYPEEQIIVQNYGYFLCENEDMQTNDIYKILEALPVKSGDIVCWEGFVPSCSYIDMIKACEEKRDYEIFVDQACHLTPDGQRLRAEKIYEGLIRYNILSEAKEAEKRAPKTKPSADFNLDENDTSELAEYKRTLIAFYRQLSENTEGASEQAVFGTIVMNCNPFTKGHRYLIDQALTQCDYLVVFVVEEDKSIFPFEDRFRLVVEGTEDLQNVIIIPSGRFIISSLTFSEYFNKSELQERVVDTSMDVLLFVREIAPCLNIKKRFAGEEPFDAVTRQYNESMKKILPEYGMEFVEISRASVSGEVISASRVRALLENKEFDAIKQLVPETTLQYLMERFK